jgi:hypothetical protein
MDQENWWRRIGNSESKNDHKSESERLATE